MNDKLKNEVKTKIAISNFKGEDMAMNKNKSKIAKIAVVACACFILTSGIVFAKDIEKIVRNLFSNTSPAIEKAIEEGYVQSTENDYTYDKDIGIKVDNLVLDDLNLNISIKFESKNEKIKYIRFNKFVIRTDAGEKIFDSDQQYVTSLDQVYTAQKVEWIKEPEKVGNDIFADSILFTMGERSREKKELVFDIQSLDLFYLDGRKEELAGNWNFIIEITEEMRNSQSIKYKLEKSNEYIESCIGTLSPTGLKVEFYLKKALNPMEYALKEEMTAPGFFFLKNDNSTFTFPKDIQVKDNSYTHYIMQYDDIGTFFEIPEKLEIFLEPYNNTIFLEKIK